MPQVNYKEHVAMRMEVAGVWVDCLREQPTRADKSHAELLETDGEYRRAWEEYIRLFDYHAALAD